MAGVFYNALLPHLGDDEELDSISNKAFIWLFRWRNSTCNSSCGLHGNWSGNYSILMASLVSGGLGLH